MEHLLQIAVQAVADDIQLLLVLFFRPFQIIFLCFQIGEGAKNR